MKLQLRHHFPVSPARAFEELFGDDYENAVSADSRLERKVLLDEQRPTGRVRRIHVVPEQRLPAAVAKVIGADRFSYVLEERHDRAGNRMDFTVTPDGMADRVSVGGSWAVKAAPGGCERVVEIDITVRIPVVGGRIEKQIAEDLRDSYESAARFAQRWLKERA